MGGKACWCGDGQAPVSVTHAYYVREALELPLDVLIYKSGSFDLSNRHDVTNEDSNFRALGEAWSQGLREAFAQLPDVEWE